MAEEKEKRTVRVRRRRRTNSDGERSREEAPQRQKESGRAPPIQYTGGGGGGTPRPPAASGPAMPLPGGGSSRMLLLAGALLVLVFLCFSILGVFSGGDGDEAPMAGLPGQDQEAPVAAIATPRPTVQANTATPFELPVSGSGTEGESWLVMLYQDADDKILEEDIFLDLNEAERAGSNDRVHIVSQVDRYQGGFRGDGDWSSTKRYYVTYDANLGRLSSQEIADLGEANMADRDTLVDFVTWAIETFPADKHALILSDHGMGWPGGWSDPSPGGRGRHDIALTSALGDQLYLMELDEALAEARARSGLEQFELVGLDACLMGHVEVFQALQPHARYAVASQETEPALGWAYTGFLADLLADPDMDGAELSRFIVQSYVQEDQRIVDDEARADFLRGGSPLGGFLGMLGSMSASQLADQMEGDVTLAAVDLQAMPSLMDSINQLAFTLQGASQPRVAQARNYAQSFTSVFGNQVPPSYLDLASFAQLVARETGDANVTAAVDDLLARLDSVVLAEKHGRNKPGARGISIYFPNSQLYGNPATGVESYTTVANRFAAASLWDDFLRFHYTGRRFEAAAVAPAVPERGAEVAAPGSGGIRISELTASDTVAAPGAPVLLTAEIAGPNIGHIYLFTGFVDEASNSIFVADRDFLESPETREIDGVHYPDWGGDEPFTLEFLWEPLMFAINDGEESALALFAPQTYGVTPDESVYTVDGTYTYVDGETRFARLYFNNSNGLLNQVYGYTGDGPTGAPREILPQQGDRFTVQEQWIDLAPAGQAAQVALQDGDTVQFGDAPLTWEELDAAPGPYVVGFIVEDLDGNAYPAYTQIAVE